MGPPAVPRMISREKVDLSVSPFFSQLIPSPLLLGANTGALHSTHTEEALGRFSALQNRELC